jgi:hypothetical protein
VSKETDRSHSEYYEGKTINWLDAFGKLVILSPILLYAFIKEAIEKMKSSKKVNPHG